MRAHAAADLPGHDRGQSGFVSGVTAAAGIQINLQIDHGNGVALHQKDTRPAGLGPMLNGQRGVGHTDGHRPAADDRPTREPRHRGKRVHEEHIRQINGEISQHQ